MRPGGRQWLLGAGLVSSLAATWIGWPEAGDQAVDVSPPVRPAPVVVQPSQDQFLPARAGLGAVRFNPFQVKQWQRPPVLVQAKEPPAPVAMAPALPFVYLGQWQEQGTTTVFLGQGARTFLVRAGDVVADYKVMAVSATEVSLLYVPLNQRQALSIGRSP